MDKMWQKPAKPFVTTIWFSTESFPHGVETVEKQVESMNIHGICRTVFPPFWQEMPL